MIRIINSVTLLNRTINSKNFSTSFYLKKWYEQKITTINNFTNDAIENKDELYRKLEIHESKDEVISNWKTDNLKNLEISRENKNDFSNFKSKSQTSKKYSKPSKPRPCQHGKYCKDQDCTFSHPRDRIQVDYTHEIPSIFYERHTRKKTPNSELLENLTPEFKTELVKEDTFQSFRYLLHRYIVNVM